MGGQLQMLTKQETIIMKAIWDYGTEMPLSVLLEQLKDDENCRYARTTVETFLLKLSGKKFVEKYNRERRTFIRPLVPLQEYRVFVFENLCDFWYGGSMKDAFQLMSTDETLAEEEREKLIKYAQVLNA